MESGWKNEGTAKSTWFEEFEVSTDDYQESRGVPRTVESPVRPLLKISCFTKIPL